MCEWTRPASRQINVPAAGLWLRSLSNYGVREYTDVKVRFGASGHLTSLHLTVHTSILRPSRGSSPHDYIRCYQPVLRFVDEKLL